MPTAMLLVFGVSYDASTFSQIGRRAAAKAKTKTTTMGWRLGCPWTCNMWRTSRSIGSMGSLGFPFDFEPKYPACSKCEPPCCSKVAVERRPPRPTAQRILQKLGWRAPLFRLLSCFCRRRDDLLSCLHDMMACDAAVSAPQPLSWPGVGVLGRGTILLG